MNKETYLREAIKRAAKDAGSILRLSQKTGMAYSAVHRLITGKVDIKNMTVGSLIKLFPELEIFCFRSDIPLQSINNKEDPTMEVLSEMIGRLSPLDRSILIGMIAGHFKLDMNDMIALKQRLILDELKEEQKNEE